MEVYYGHLLQDLRPLLSSEDEITGFIPKHVVLKPKLFRYWSQYINYPLAAYFAQGNINHIIDHSYGHLLHSLNSSKTIVTFHDANGLNYSDTTARGSQTILYALKGVNTYNFSGLLKAAFIICDSESSRRDLLQYINYSSDKTAVVPLGVDESFFQDQNSGDIKQFGLQPGRHILHVGHTHSYKNIPALFRVLSILNHSFKMNLKLLKVGEVFSPEQENLARTLGIWESVVQLGALDDKLMPAIYRSADVLLFPSLNEGFGFPVLEAMASGLPVVASNRGALPEVLGDAGILVAPDDYEAMAKSVVAIFNNPSLRSDLSKSGTKRASLFTWEKTARKTLEIYNRLYAQNKNCSRDKVGESGYPKL